jgi:hypothetical protein
VPRHDGPGFLPVHAAAMRDAPLDVLFYLATNIHDDLQLLRALGQDQPDVA